MLSDEQLIEQIRTELRSELADLNPPPDLFDRLLEPAESDGRSQRGSRERSADRRDGRGWRARGRGLGAAVPVLAGVIVVLAIAAVALTSVRHHQASSPGGPAVAARNGKVAFIAFGGGGYPPRGGYPPTRSEHGVTWAFDALAVTNPDGSGRQNVGTYRCADAEVCVRGLLVRLVCRRDQDRVSRGAPARTEGSHQPRAVPSRRQRKQPSRAGLVRGLRRLERGQLDRLVA